MQIAVFSPPILKCLHLWVPCQRLWDWTQPPGRCNVYSCCIPTSELLLPEQECPSSSENGYSKSSRIYPSPAHKTRDWSQRKTPMTSWTGSRAPLLCPGWMESVPESRRDWGDEMHTYHVTLNSQRKEKPDLQPSVQRLFYTQNSSWTQLLFSLIKTKQR